MSNTNYEQLNAESVDPKMIALLNCQALRALEYPPIQDYIDGVVKGDQAQINEYINKCIAIKQKYPKPE
jgi:hypothetical protein